VARRTLEGQRPKRSSGTQGGAVRAFLLLLLLLAASPAFGSGRRTLNFNPDWKFLKDDPPGAARPDFPDNSWITVSTPHTFNDVDTFDDWSVPNHVGETNQWTGRTWYRKSFTLPEEFRGRRVYLEIEAVRQIAEVYLNGQPLGTNRTGFIPFGFDLTPHLRFGGATNVLAVMADNRFTPETDLTRIAATELPWNSPHWHPAHGGIYRNVYLHVTDPLHITLPLYSTLQTAGPYIYATDISTEEATVRCEVPVSNGRAGTEKVTAEVKILDREGKTVLELQQVKSIGNGAQTIFAVSSILRAPQAWEPDYPYLYQADCTLLSHGQVVDSCSIPFGIRSVRWDVKSGFYINGHHLKLRGWGQRPTSEWPGLGAAQPDWMHYYTLALMKEAGGNFVRWGHCAGAPADIASADQLGLLVLQPGVDGEGDAQGEAWTLRAAAFRDMLIYYRNHPSIIIWEGGNQKVTRDHARELRGLMDTLDPHGGRAYAHRRPDAATAEFMDVDLGTEGGRESAHLPVVEAEYDREESPRRVWDEFSPPNFGYPEAKGQTYQLTSEQYAVNQIEQWVTKIGYPWHCGGANWIFSDSTSGGRLSCEVARASGEVDGMRLPKEAYFVLRTMFRNDPQVHIIGHWTYPPGTRKTVYVTSNCSDVELFLNGKSLGRGAVSNRYLFVFPGVPFESGELKAVAYRDGKAGATQSKYTAGQPVALRLTPRLGPGGFLANGEDVALIDVEAVDAQGERCPTFQQRVDFDQDGPAVWRGGYNSGKAHSINNHFLDLECGINRIALRSTRAPGIIELTAHSGSLPSATLTLTSACVTVTHGFTPALPALPPPPALPGAKAEDLLILADSRPETRPSAGRFLRAFSYSGPSRSVSVRRDAQDGQKIYADREYLFTGLPASLSGCDWVQAAGADKLYSAVDLMELAVGVDGIIYVAHDNRLPRPDWLQNQFQPTSLQFAVNGKTMAVFEHRVRGGESLTLGSNSNDLRLKSSNMYVVFISESSSPGRTRQAPADSAENAAAAPIHAVP
jgi:beta-galactosidase